MSMNEDAPIKAPEVVSWWSASGWRRDAPPGVYIAAWTASLDPAMSITGAMKAAGYTAIRLARDEFEAQQIDLNTHRDGHMQMEIWLADCCLQEFFVAAEDVAAFLVEKLPNLLQGMRALNREDIDSRMLKTLIAFVRHGHGEETIGQDATWDRDDAIEARRQRAERQRQKANS